MSYFRAENLSLHFGGLKAVDAVSFAVARPARQASAASSARIPLCRR